MSCGAAALAVLALAAAPARVAGASRVSSGVVAQALWMSAGVLRDLAAVVLLVAPAVLMIAFVAPALLTRLRSARWQRAGGAFAAVPCGLAVWVLGVAAQEFKVERGVYPTVFDFKAQGASSVFLGATLGYLRYDVYWGPALVFAIAGGLLLRSRARRRADAAPLAWRPWLSGLAVSLALGAAGLRLFVASTSTNGRFGVSALGDPFQAMVDSGADLIAYGKGATARELVRDARLRHVLARDGAALLGWPPARAAAADVCRDHPHERPLDRAMAPPIADPRGEDLVRAFEEVGSRLFPLEDDGILVWQLTLESFRADDLSAVNARAAREIAPFVNGLYEAAARGDEGVLASRATYQAGVRTAQGLGALSCGLGTLPYNLSLIRDLHPVRVRCLSDVLTDAGFRASFFYGSDVTFDGMGAFFGAHGFSELIAQPELPLDAPRGAWGAVTDHVLVDETTRRIATSTRSPHEHRFVMLTSLSNHSPFDAPGDLSAEVESRVDHALNRVMNRAGRDDRARLLTYSYTDAAVARFFARLEELRLAARSIVVIAADHSTGEAYVWGPEDGAETDDAKARIPFLVVLPSALRERARDRGTLDDAMRVAQRALDAGPLSQNDVPSLVLSLLSAHPALRAMRPAARWHTLGGQITSPWFEPMGRPGAYVLGINGVSQLVAFDRRGERVGDYEEAVFLKTRGDRATVTPTLTPITSCLSPLLDRCASEVGHAL